MRTSSAALRLASSIVLLAAALIFWCDDVAGASFGGSEGHACSGCADGTCVPRAASYGHYRTVWRRWPAGTAPTTTVSRDGSISELPDAEIPDVVDEGRIRKRTRLSKPTGDESGAKPSEVAPKVPDVLDEVPGQDQEDDPFRNIPDDDMGLDLRPGTKAEPGNGLPKDDGGGFELPGDDLFAPEGEIDSTPSQPQEPPSDSRFDDLFGPTDQSSSIRPSKPMRLRLANADGPHPRRHGGLDTIRQVSFETPDRRAPQADEPSAPTDMNRQWTADLPFQEADLEVVSRGPASVPPTQLEPDSNDGNPLRWSTMSL